MSQELKQALLRREAGRVSKQGELRISSQVTRSQADNLEDAMNRLQSILDEAAESIKPIESNPEKVKQQATRKKRVCTNSSNELLQQASAAMVALVFIQVYLHLATSSCLSVA
jgi:preprotein translocase subunit SecF